MTKYDWVGFSFLALVFVAIIWSTVPAALHRHSCMSLDVGTVEGCE